MQFSRPTGGFRRRKARLFMIKVVKFGGSSLADADHFRQVAEIVHADKDRHYVVASAPGKRYSADVKVTDMLYRCYEMVRARENIDEYYEQIKKRYNDIIADLGLDFDISGELDYIRNAIEHLIFRVSLNTSRTRCCTRRVVTMPHLAVSISIA